LGRGFVKPLPILYYTRVQVMGYLTVSDSGTA